MGFLQNLGVFMSGVGKAYREAFLNSDRVNTIPFESFAGRTLRYGLNWAYYENTAYDNIHPFAQGYRNQRGLYKYVRTIYNPAFRLAENYVSAIYGGQLDVDAGETGAIPITVSGGNETQLRAAIAQTWEWSNWDIVKDIYSLYGTTLGDVFLYVNDDAEHEQVRTELLHPAVVVDITLSPQGFVKAYIIEEKRFDNDGKQAVYRETCERGEGESVIFRTYRDGKPYHWDGNEAAEWTVNYGFIPLVAVQHKNIGLKWGWAEMHPLRGKIAETDDLASKLHDQIRKVIDAPGMITGALSKNISITTPEPTVDNPQPLRETNNLIFTTNENAAFHPMVGNLNIGDTMLAIESMLKEMERDFPEMREDVWGNNAKEEGIKAARDRVEKKIITRRASYDKGLVRALQMALAIGGERGYKNYNGINLKTYKDGNMDFRIAPRPVFTIDRTEQISLRMQEIELEQMERGLGNREAVNVA
jgi:hypothetical protein